MTFALTNLPRTILLVKKAIPRAILILKELGYDCHWTAKDDFSEGNVYTASSYSSARKPRVLLYWKGREVTPCLPEYPSGSLSTWKNSQLSDPHLWREFWVRSPQISLIWGPSWRLYVCTLRKYSATECVGFFFLAPGLRNFLDISLYKWGHASWPSCQNFTPIIITSHHHPWESLSLKIIHD